MPFPYLETLLRLDLGEPVLWEQKLRLGKALFLAGHSPLHLALARIVAAVQVDTEVEVEQGEASQIQEALVRVVRLGELDEQEAEGCSWYSDWSRMSPCLRGHC